MHDDAVTGRCQFLLFKDFLHLKVNVYIYIYIFLGGGGGIKIFANALFVKIRGRSLRCDGFIEGGIFTGLQ